jgi:quinol monooxygenase YgiN
MFVLHAHITIVPGAETAFEALAQRLTVATLRSEAGVRRYEYFRLATPRHYLTVLAFDDHEAFIEHQASEHHEVLAGAMTAMIESISLDRVDPLPVEPSAEPGSLDSVEPAVLEARRVRYRTRYPFPGADWWSAT